MSPTLETFKSLFKHKYFFFSKQLGYYLVQISFFNTTFIVLELSSLG